MRKLLVGIVVALANGQSVFADVDCSTANAKGQPLSAACLTVVEQLPPINISDGSGQIIQVENERRWKPICGSDTSHMTQAEFAEIVSKCKESLAAGPTTIISHAATRGGLFTLVFNVSGSPPAGATAALDAISTYYESQFSDPVTVTFNISFAALGPGILGSTGADFMNNVPYTSIRSNLVNQADFDDIIQNFLPTGSTCPVRYDSNSATISNQFSMDLTEANWAAVLHIDVAGSNADITFSTNFTFDYDPGNGITGGQTCFRSVCVHEVGHALGFTSKVDNQASDMEMLDLYRFQFTDGAGDYNPDDASEFQTRPRLVHYNSPDDSHHTELMASNQTLIEYRMSDGTPSQASHWRSQGNPGIGIMNPSIGSGITYAPNYLRTADFAALDAIGWDYPPVDPGDLDPPTPNPMSFSIPPAGASVTSISMQATLANDVETPPVQYQFDFVGGSAIGHDSAWLASRNYVDSSLVPNNFYRYRVRAADSRMPEASPPGPNATNYSTEFVAYTFIETPSSVSFGATDDSSIVVNADGTFTNPGFGVTGFYFEMNPPAGSGANAWVSDPTVTVTGLVPCTQYTFRAKARNLNGDETPFTSAVIWSTTGCTGCLLLGDVDGNGTVEGADIAGFTHVKLGAPEPGELPLCADYGTGTLDGDTVEFVNDLLTAP